MSVTISCRTRFDITATGVRNNYKPQRLPYRQDNGEVITDRQHWERARNQQRNWETMNQIISLRCLPEDITQPRRQGDDWVFEFKVANPASIVLGDDAVGQLVEDAQGVPMITDLDETPGLAASIRCLGEQCNTWFELRDN